MDKNINANDPPHLLDDDSFVKMIPALAALHQAINPETTDRPLDEADLEALPILPSETHDQAEPLSVEE